jgi:acetylornithine deacetylase/succinyl-diaminopimelate desuccinylase family protein
MSIPTNVTKLLRDLVAIPSVNPTGDPGTDRVGEAVIAKYVANFLRKIGAEVRIDEVLPGRPNVIGTFHPIRKKTAHLVFAPHTDTVSVVGMTIPPFDPIMRNGKIYGRGSSDTKGPMAAMLCALQKWSTSRERANSSVQWSFAALMGEEAGNDGAIHLANTKLNADLVIVGEPTQMEIVYAHKGALWLTINTHGKACHSSMPEKGKNAIYSMGRILETFENKIIPYLKKKRHSRLGATSVSVGTIRGGSKVNIVPDFCTVECDFRTIPNFDNRKVQQFVTKKLKQVIPDVQIIAQRSPQPLDTDVRSPWIKSLSKVASGFNVAPWFCDAAIFAQQGWPAIAFGPGSIAQAHTKDEFIQIRDLEKGHQAILKFLLSN